MTATRAAASRRLAGLALLVVLAVAAGTGVWRAVHDRPADRVEQIATGLKCPSCQGESVAQSHSPIAAAMRSEIAQQVGEGRSTAAIRSWFAQRYGSAVLLDPPAHGVGILLWLLPAAALAVAVALAIRAVRRRAPPASPAAAPSTSAVGRPRSAAGGPWSPTRRRPGTARSVHARRVWDAVAVGVVVMVAAVAVAARTTKHPVAQAAAQDPVQTELTLAASLEQQGQYAAAADLYRQANRERPDDQVRLKLAFALLRAGQPGEAADDARQVLASRPDDPDGLLLLGLAQRAGGSPDATATLRHFLQVAPQHPAATEIRRLVGQP